MNNSDANATGGTRTIEHKTQDIILLVIYTFILTTGVIGNSLIICFFGFKTRSKQLFNHYLLHLAIADIIACLATSGHYLYDMVSQQWDLGLVLCKIVSSLGPLTVNVSAWIITTIAIERNRGISTPLKKRFGKAWIQMVMISIWFASIITLIPYAYSMNVVYGKCTPSWKEEVGELSYAIVTLFIQSIIPSIMMVFILLNIKKSITQKGPTLVRYKKNDVDTERKNSEKRERSTTVSLIFDRFSRKRRNSMKRQNKLIIMLAAAFVAFIICSLPYNIFYAYIVYAIRFQNIAAESKQYKNIKQANTWLSLLVVMNSCFNFFIYAGLDKDFTQFCKSIVTKKKKHHRFRGSTLSANLSFHGR